MRILLIIAASFIVMLVGACTPKAADSSSSGTSSKSLLAPPSSSQPALLQTLSGKETLTRKDLSALSAGDLKLLQQARFDQRQKVNADLELSELLGEYLCQQLITLRQNCPIFSPLLPGGGQGSALQCRGDSGGPPAPSSIEVTIPANKSGHYVLIANDIFVSSVFVAGTTTINFTSSGAQNTAIPKFAAIWKLVLRSAPGTDLANLQPLPDLSGFVLQLKVGGTAILTTALGPSTDKNLAANNREYRVDVGQVLSLAQSSTCSISSETIDLQEQQLASSVAEKQAAKNKKTAAAPGGDLITSILSLQTDIGSQLVLLNESKNRHYLLRSEVSSEVALGCHSDTPIKKLVVEIDGSIIDREIISQQGNPLPSTNASKSKTLIIDLGGINFFVDLGATNILRSTYQVPDDFSQHTISEIRQVALTKVGTMIDNLRECHKDMLIFDTCQFSSYEEDLINIDGVSIMVNDMLVYEKKNITSKLKHDIMSLKFNDVQHSDAWLRLMQRDDCQVVQ